MQKSQDRILVTHAGSLPRGEPLGSMLIDQEASKLLDATVMKKAIEARVTHVLNKQVEVGIDEVNDGEQGRIGFQTYVAQRMSGFGGVSNRPYGQDWTTFPQFSERFFQRLPLALVRSTTLRKRPPTSNTRVLSISLWRPSGWRG